MNNANPEGICPNCYKRICYQDRFCRHCNAPNDSWRKPSASQCGNCHAILAPDDAYCRYCGTKAGEGEFLPYQNLMQCIYGPPPMERTHTCVECGYSWTTCEMIDSGKYCPKCGGSAPAILRCGNRSTMDS